MASLRQQEARRRAVPQGGFDFTLSIRRLVGDMVHRLPELRHVDLDRVAISFSQTRKPVAHGMYASLMPMRFADGQLETERRGRRWTIQRLYGPSGSEMLYILSLYLPRFLDLSFREKLMTVVHELWHIGPKFDGDLRRFDGRCFAHTGSQKDFDAHAARLADRWLALAPPLPVYGFLRYSYRDLVTRHGRVFGTKIRTPKLIPVE